jgi:transcription antitermination factor NusA-like protein
MLTKICAVDLKSGILCPKCEEKVRSGEVSQLDLKVAKVLLDLENKYPALQTVYFHKAIESGDNLVILVDRGDVSKILSYGGRILREISEKTGKRRVRILAYNDEPRRFLEYLFAPASILTINKIWLPDGSEETKVVIPRKDMRKLPGDIQVLKEFAKSIMGMTLRVEFESPKSRVI